MKNFGKWKPIPIPQGMSEQSAQFFGRYNEHIAATGQKLFFDLPENYHNHAAWKEKVDAVLLELEPLNREAEAIYQPKLRREHIAGVPVIWVEPLDARSDARAPTLVYFHGGGFVFHSGNTQLVGAIPLAAKTGMRVLIVDYGTAPGQDFRGIQEQSWSVLQALIAQGCPAEHIALYGDSAGGNLAVQMTQRFAQAGLAIGALYAISPWMDLAGRTESYAKNEPLDPLCSAESLGRCAQSYAQGVDLTDPRISPCGLSFQKPWPPTLIQYAYTEMLADDALILGERLRAAGVDVTIEGYPMWHAHQTCEWFLPESQCALDRAASFLRKLL